MNKETIRPILLEELEKAQAEERALANPKEDRLSNWETLAALLEARQKARLRRAQAELQLWLADQQWARQEREAHLLEREAELAGPPSETVSKTSKA